MDNSQNKDYDILDDEIDSDDDFFDDEDEEIDSENIFDDDNDEDDDSDDEPEEDTSTSNDSNENVSESPLLAAGDVSLTLGCEVASINMDLEQLSKLKLNDIVEFVPWPSQVKLSLNGNYFAQGELVEINGMLGVKITSK